MKGFISVLILATLPSMGSAQAYRAINQLVVVPLGGGDFEVIEARGDGARGMWCAAADYTLHRLGHSRQQRLYVKTPRGNSISGAGRKGVVFTTDVNSLPVQPTQSVSVSVRSAGQGLPVNHAYQFCRDYEIDEDDILFWRKRD